jgi:eukaryotic-like serine/threonine-protein kinase
VTRREPEVFGDYFLYGKIAAGGMASVFLAKHRGESDQWLAVKRVHPHLTSREDVRQMFLNEASLLSRLDHPNICGIRDYGIHDDLPYIVMRYLHGQPLSGLIRRTLDLEKPLPVDLMAYVCACTCEGLHYAHEAKGDDGPLGLVHRDISPQNIFITFAGEVKLLDFGVAKAAGYHGLTRTGHIKGKYAYMSPEQVEAQPLDRRSDLFSLGIVLWESLTGRHLFKRKREIDTLRAISKASVPAVSEMNPSVSAQLDQIVAKALLSDPTYRFQSAKEMGDALWKYLTTSQVPMGADEVAEVMSDVYPDAPPPGEVWPNATELEIPVLTEEDSLAQPTLQDLQLAELEELADVKTERAQPEHDTDEHPLPGDETVPQPLPGPLMERPRVHPHPFDAEHGGTLQPDVPDTLVTEEGEALGARVSTIPREAISDNPEEPPGPTIQMRAQSRPISIEERAPSPSPSLEDAPTRNPSPTHPGDGRSWVPLIALLMVALVIGLAVITYFAMQA